MSIKLEFYHQFALPYIEKMLDDHHIITARSDRLISKYFNEKEERCTLGYASAQNYMIIINVVRVNIYVIIHYITVDMKFLSEMFDNAYADHLGKMQHENKVLRDHLVESSNENAQYKTLLGKLEMNYLSDYRTSFTNMMDHIIKTKREVLNQPSTN